MAIRLTADFSPGTTDDKKTMTQYVPSIESKVTVYLELSSQVMQQE